MAKNVKIGTHFVGDGEPCFITAEVGINHHGNVDLAKKLISAAAVA
jgi:N-acetylneuraminate synthase